MRPGLVALVLLAVLGLGAGLQAITQQEILERAYSQVFIVACDSTSYGTGWWVNEQGYAVTAYHVVDSCSSITGVRGSWSSPLELIAYDEELDVALLKAVEPPEWAEGLPLSFDVSIGDEVYVVGYPVQLVATVDGDLAKASIAPRVLRATITWLDPYASLAAFQPATDAGNSGGPAVSSESGGVVGIVVFARKGVVSEEYYLLRMDALAGFLEQNNIDYRVARSSNIVLMLGLGAALALGLVFALTRGVRA